jgi:hypothetical protein
MRTDLGSELSTSGKKLQRENKVFPFGGLIQRVSYSSGITAVNPGKYNFRALNTCYSGIAFKANGSEYINLAGNPEATNLVGQWLDFGDPADYWVEVIETVGNFTFGALGRLQLNQNRAWYVLDDNPTSSPIGGVSVTCYFNFYDAAAGGNLLYTTQTSVYTAEYEVGP